MSDNLDLRGIDQRHEPDPQFRARLHTRLAAIVTGIDPGPVGDAPGLSMIDLEPATEEYEPSRNGRQIAKVILAVAAAVAIILVASSGAEVVMPADEVLDSIPIDPPEPRAGDITEVVSPLVDIRSRIVNRGNVELFTVATETPRYLALSALGEFDGTRWTTLTEDISPAVGTLSDAPVGAELVTQRITIKKLGGELAPAARTATSAAWEGPTLSYAKDAGAFYVQDGLQPNYQYQVTSVDNFPLQSDLRAATVDRAPNPIYYELPGSIPNEVRDLAFEVTAAATTPFDKAMALKDWFKQFDYSTNVQSGHGNDAMLNFLSIREGYCEQFAGTFAAMARAIGLPTRLVVGFTQGVLRADGLYHVAGHHAHAWDEVWFDGYGWVQFDPTPGRGALGAGGTTGDEAQQAAP